MLISLRKISLFILLLCSAGAWAQDFATAGNFAAQERKGKVYLNWQILAGRTCNGMRIYRSQDSIHFYQIGEIGGVCGSTSKPMPYSFVDQEPLKNKRNYYRLYLGVEEHVDTKSVEVIDIYEKAYQIRPNPMGEFGKFYFSNPAAQTYSLSLYNSLGQLSQVYESSDNYFDLDVSVLQKGLYIFKLESKENNQKLVGKMLVVH